MWCISESYQIYVAINRQKETVTNSPSKAKRLAWSKARRLWVQRQWDSVIFSDESKFDVCVGDSRTRVIRKRNEAYHTDCLRRAVKFPASVMVWGCMSSKGVGKLHFIDGTIKAMDYVNILETNLLPSIPNLSTADEYIFQQDGAPPHTAKLTKNWFLSKNIPVLDWPASSPDLNPIESLWALMKRRLRNDPRGLLMA